MDSIIIIIIIIILYKTTIAVQLLYIDGTLQ